MSKVVSSADRCSQLKSAFDSLQSFEVIGIRQTSTADEIVLSWNGSTKFNANKIQSDIQRFVNKSNLKLPNDKAWKPVGFPAFEKISTKNKIIFDPNKKSKKLFTFKEQSRWLYGYRSDKLGQCFVTISYVKIRKQSKGDTDETNGVSILVPHKVIINNTNDGSENIENTNNIESENIRVEKRKQYQKCEFKEVCLFYFVERHFHILILKSDNIWLVFILLNEFIIDTPQILTI